MNLTNYLDPNNMVLMPPPDQSDTGVNGLEPKLTVMGLPTDLDASLRFAEAYVDDLRYCTGIGWLCWDGRRWAIEGAQARALELSKQSARWWTQEAAKCDVDREKRIKGAMTLEGASRIAAAVSLAESDPRLKVEVGELDRDPMVLNVQNGTVDLRTGVLRPHSRADLITKVAHVTYDASARSLILERYLAVVEGHMPGMASFLARCFGVALTGNCETESLFLLQGDGGSGKTTLVEAMAAMLGDYSVKLNFDSFCQSKHGRSGGAASPDLIPLRGSRLAYASEGDVSARLDAGKVKELTGNEPITARALYENPVTFPPSWKLWLVSNFEPKVDSDDSGMWRRMIKLHFAVIPSAERDPMVKRMLTTDPVTWSALLNWALAGCLDWQTRSGGREGLASPAAVEAATNAYRAKMDTMSEWWEDLLSVYSLREDGVSTTKELRSHYERWCQDNGASPVFAQRFAAYLESKGLKAVRTSTTRSWRGIEAPF